MRLLERIRTRRHRLRPLSEAECYERCHGEREHEIRVVRVEPKRRREGPRLSGEDLRRRFEERLDARAPTV